jgi:hypothetical protein
VSSVSNDLKTEFQKSQAQFAYFQLGAAASAIAYAVHETKGQSLSTTPYLIIVGVFVWMASFFFGCIGEDARLGGMVTNIHFLDLTKGLTPAEMQSEIISKMTHDTKEAVGRGPKFFKRQLWLFFVGSALYVAGHGWQMWKTPPSAASISTALQPIKNAAVGPHG